MKRELKNLPNQQLMRDVWEHCLIRRNQKGETNREINECLFALCWKAGLRISEAAKFDLELELTEKENKGLFKLRGKGKKDRIVYIDENVRKILKDRKWRPQEITHNTRVCFGSYLYRVKRELNWNDKIELSPHTLRRCFATYNANNGMPLPVLQRYLGHSKISTTALYIRDSELETLKKFRPIQ